MMQKICLTKQRCCVNVPLLHTNERVSHMKSHSKPDFLPRGCMPLLPIYQFKSMLVQTNVGSEDFKGQDVDMAKTSFVRFCEDLDLCPKQYTGGQKSCSFMSLSGYL